MIDALAGSGKTTQLRHLAWQYGKPGEKWLYLVFNNRNKVEAETKFPPWVEVKTTNSFLGTLLETEENLLRIPLTQRIIKLAQKNRKQAPGKSRPQKGNRGKGAKNLSKIRIIADGPQFAEVIGRAGIPIENSPIVDNRLSYENDATQTVVKYVCLQSLLRQFKEQVIKLAELAKSFALDVRNKEQFQEGLKKVLGLYDIDTTMSSVKEKISKRYKDNPRYLQLIMQVLNSILGYDFMSKDYAPEIIEATEWILQKTLPMGTDEIWERDATDDNGQPIIDPRTRQPMKEQFPLGQYRDFSDDIWYAAVHANDIRWPHYDVVMADEVQDFNEGQKIMLQKLQEAGAKIIAVGDPQQSIYRFRGADDKAFQSIGQMLTDSSEDKNVIHRLTKNFRSRQAIIDFANERTHVKGLQRGKNFKDGGEGVVTDQQVHYDDVFTGLGQETQENNGVVLQQTAFISRTNQPLVHAALRLLTMGVPFVIVGKDIAEDLKEHVYKVIREKKRGEGELNEQSPVYLLKDKLESFRQEEEQFHGGRAMKAAYLQDMAETTEALLAAIMSFEGEQGQPSQAEAYGYGYGYGYGRPQRPSWNSQLQASNDYNTGTPGQEGPSIGDFLKWLNQKLGAVELEEGSEDQIRKNLQEYNKKVEENAVVLTTSHKSKGLEFARVFILRDDLFPHPKAKRPEDKLQEENARYVSYTRAMDELHIVALDGQPGYKKKAQQEGFLQWVERRGLTLL